MRRSVHSLGVSLLGLTLWICSLTVRGIAQPTPVPNLDDWINEAEVIVIGRVLAPQETVTADEGPSDSHNMTATIHVDHVLKGSADSQVLAIKYQGYPHPEKSNTVLPSRYNLLDNQYGLIFLTRKKEDIYTFADPYQGLIPVTSRTVRLVETAHTAKEKVEAELFASLSDANPKIAMASLTQVRFLGVEQFIKPLHGIASSTDPVSQGLAFSALIKLGDYS